MLLHDAMGDAETEPSTFPRWLGGKEGVEDAGGDLCWNAAAIIAYTDAMVEGEEGNMTRAIWGIVGDGMDGILNEIYQNLHELVGVGLDDEIGCGLRKVDADEFRREQTAGRGKQAVNSARLALGFSLVGEAANGRNDFLYTFQTIAHIAQSFVIVTTGFEHRETSDYVIDWIVDLVHETSGQTTEGGEALAGYELGLGLAQCPVSRRELALQLRTSEHTAETGAELNGGKGLAEKVIGPCLKCGESDGVIGAAGHQQDAS